MLPFSSSKSVSSLLRGGCFGGRLRLFFFFFPARRLVVRRRLLAVEGRFFAAEVCEGMPLKVHLRVLVANCDLAMSVFFVSVFATHLLDVLHKGFLINSRSAIISIACALHIRILDDG